MVYIVDGVKVDQLFYEELKDLNEEVVDHTNLIQDQSKLDDLGYSNAESLYQIYTKAYVNRSDSLKRIPSTKQMERKEGKWYIKGENKTYTGAFRDYYLNGNLKGNGNLVDGKLEGKRWLYYKDGSISEELNYKNGFPEGKEIRYFPDGKIKQTGNYTEGYEVGEWKKFHENGELKQVSYFTKNGKLNGEVKTYYSTGKLKGSSEFVNGKMREDRKTKKVTADYEAAKKNFQLGKFNEAIQLFSKCIQSKPNWNDAYFARGTAYLNNNEFDKALDDFNKAIEIEPLDAYAYTNRAFTLIRKQEFNKARETSLTKDIQVFGIKKVAIPKDDLEKICQDLQQALALGDESRMLLDSIAKYCK